MAEHFVNQLNAPLRVSPQALRLLQGYAWPGNIRQLANVVRRAVVMCNGDTILPEHLESSLLGDVAENPSQAPSAGRQSGGSLSPERFLELSPCAEDLQKLTTEELQGMLDSLRALETRLVSAMGDRGLGTPARRCLKDTEEETIRHALVQHRWNITETAKILGIGRNTLYRKIKEYGLGGG